MIPEKNIVLCGFMGCGKSTLGRALAERLSASFIDADDYLVEREGMSIPEMFRLYSESGFRDREHNVITELSRRRGIILATGGGALTFERNIKPLKQTGHILYLNVDFDACYSRIAKSDRPLVRSNNREQLEQIYSTRHEIYHSVADYELKAVSEPHDLAEAAIRVLGIDNVL